MYQFRKSPVLAVHFGLCLLFVVYPRINGRQLVSCTHIHNTCNKRLSTYIAPQTAYCAAVRHRESLGRSPSPHSRTSACSQTTCHFNGIQSRNPHKYMHYYSFTDAGGMQGWVGLAGWQIADNLSTKSIPTKQYRKALKTHTAPVQLLPAVHPNHTGPTIWGQYNIVYQHNIQPIYHGWNLTIDYER